MIEILTVIVIILAILAAVMLVQVSILTAKLNNAEQVIESEHLVFDSSPRRSVEEMLSHEVSVPVEDGDYHGHPKYLYIFIGLLALFGISLVSDIISNNTAVILLIFSTALIKALMVITRFMHLKYEPKLIIILVLGVVFCLAAFFWGIYPDIVMKILDVVK